MTSFLLVWISILMLSCSGYFSTNNNSDGLQADNLALVNGDTLSLTLFNDICPFIYKTPGDKKFLFFASDRPIPGETNKSFDIWVSLMVGDRFTQPRTISNITSPYNEINPVIHEFGGKTYITLIGGMDQKASVYSLNISNNQIYSATYLSSIPGSSNYNLILLKRNNTDILITTFGSNLGAEFLFDGTNWSPVRARYFSSSVGKGHGFVYSPLNNSFQAECYIFEHNNGQHWQIDKAFLGNGQYYSAVVSGFFPLPEYGSVILFNDRTPFLDLEDRKMYFASDRYHLNDKYDLYRYNETTYSSQFSLGGIEYYPLPPGVYVAENAPLSGNGLSPGAPLPSIPEAILTARAQGLSNIYVAAGTYTPSNLGLEADGTHAGFTVTNAPLRFLGGYNSSFTKRTGISILDAQGVNCVVVASNINGLYLDGFRITGGYRASDFGGGLVLNKAANSLIINSQIVYNTNDGLGGAGIEISGTNNIIDCYIAHNYLSSGEGAGVYIQYNTSSLYLFGHIVNNISDNRAGGVYISDGPSTYFSAVITNNTGASYVGGVLYGNSPPDMGDSLMTNNIPSDLQSGV